MDRIDRELIYHFRMMGHEEAAQGLEKAAAGGAKLSQAFAKVGVESTKAQKRINDLTNATYKFQNQTQQTLKTVGDLASLLTSTAAWTIFGKQLSDYQKQLFDLSRQSKLTGQSYGEMRQALDEMQRTTGLTRMESVKFFRTLQDATKGVKLTGKEMRGLAETLTAEFGPALEDVQGAMQDLMDIQQKELGVLDKVKKGFDPGELASYAQTLRVVYGANEKQIQTLFRVARARALGSKGLTDEEKNNIRLKASIQKLTQVGQEFMLKVAEPMGKMLTEIADQLGFVIQKFQGLAPIIGKIALPATAAGALAYGGLKVARGIGGLRETIGGLRGGGRGGGTTPTGGRGKGLGGASGMAAAAMGQVAAGDVVKVWVVNLPGGGMGPGMGMGSGSTAAGRAAKGAGRARFAGGTAARGGILSRAGGWLGRTAGGFLRGGGGLALGGMALGMGSEYLGEKIGGKTGGAVGALGGIAGSTASGAGLGAMFGPVGAAIGAVGGAAYGLYENFDKLEESLGKWGTALVAPIPSLLKLAFSADDAGKKIEKAGDKAAPTGKAAYESRAGDIERVFGLGAKDRDLFESQVLAKMEDMPKKIDDLSQAQVSTIIKRGQAVQAGGGELGAPGWLAEATQGNIALRIARQGAARRGLTGTAAEEFAEEKAAKLRMGGTVSEDLRDAFQEAMRGGNFQAEMQRAAIEFQVGPKELEEAKKVASNVIDESVDRRMRVLREELEQVNALSEKFVGLSMSMAEQTFLLTGNMAQAARHYADAAAMLDLQDARLAELQKNLQQVVKGGEMSKEAYEASATVLRKMGMDEDQIRQALNNQIAAATTLKQVEDDRLGIQSKRIKLALDEVAQYERQATLAADQVGLIEAQMELSKAQFLGAAPTIDLQLQAVEALENQVARMGDALQKVKEKRAADEAAGKDSFELRRKQISLETAITNAQKKQLDITKSLREGYLDAMQAFTNVQGSFGKIILTQEMGVGEIMRKFRAPGSIREGAVGAGADNPMMRWRKGAAGAPEFDVMGMREWQKTVLGYDPHIFKPQEAIPSVARAITEGPGGGSPYIAQELYEQTGLGSGGPGGYSGKNLTQKMVEGRQKAAAGPAAGPTGEQKEEARQAVGDVSNPLKALNDNMSRYVAEGIVAAGAMGGANGPPTKESFEESKKRLDAILGETKETKEQAEEANDKAEKDAAQGRKEADEASRDKRKLDEGKTGPDALKDAVKTHADKMQADMDAWLKKFKDESMDKVVERGAAFYTTMGMRQRMADERLAGKKRPGDVGDAAAEAEKKDIAALAADAARKANAARGTGETETERKNREMLDLVRRSGGVPEGAEGLVPPEVTQKFQKEVEARRGTEEGRRQFEAYLAGDRGEPVDEDALRADMDVRNRSRRMAREARKQAAIDEARHEQAAAAAGVGGTAGYSKSDMNIEEDFAPPGQKSGKGLDVNVKNVGPDAKRAFKESYEEGNKQNLDKQVQQQTQQAMAQGIPTPSEGGGVLRTGIGMKMLTGSMTYAPGDSSGYGPGFQHGGRVSGYGGGDVVPAMLEPGEFVVNKRSASRFAKFLHSINASRFASGGVVPPSDMARGGGGFAPRLSINVRGDSVNRIMHSVQRQLGTTLSDMMTPSGTTGRFFDLPNTG